MSMESYENMTSKRQKFQNKDNFISSSSSSSDTINDLPEHLVSYILSLLPTEEAIKTSILSKRWRFLWTTISNLDFSDEKVYYYKNYDDKLYYEGGYDEEEYDDDGNGEEGYDDVRIQNFTNYVYRVLNLLKPTSIHKFTIILDRYSDLFRVDKWISDAVVRNVRDLTLSLDGCGFADNPIDVPFNVFHCKTLEVLRLTEGVFFNIPKQESVCFLNLKFLSLDGVDICGIPAEKGSVCFPKLETLHLLCVKFVGNDDSVTKFMRNCPVLEDLFIRRAVRDTISNTDMCIPALRSAELCFPTNGIRCKVEIDAPLKYLKIINWTPPHKVLVKYPDSLIEAELNICDYKRGDYQGEQRHYVLTVIKAVDKVKCLTLSYDTVDAIKTSNIKLPLFCNLIQLVVTLNCKGLCVLQCLLNNSINLQILVIEKKYSPPCGIEDTRWTELSDVPKCLLTSLKKVEIDSVDGCTDELAMIKDMLKYAKILKKLTTKYRFRDVGDIHKKRSLVQKISMFPRASAVCEVEFL